MSFIDFILNVAGVLLWLNWCSARHDPFTATAPATLAGTIRRTEPLRLKRWHFLAALGGLLLLRAVFYWQLGAAINWPAKLSLGITAPYFRSDFFSRMLLFSVLGFLVALIAFYIWIVLLSMLHPRGTQNDPAQKLIRLSLGKVDRLPRGLKLALPFLAVMLFWLALAPMLARLDIIPAARSFARYLGQAALLGLWTYLSLKYLIGALLGLYILHSYVYFGNHPFWNSVNLIAKRLLAPLRPLPLRLGKVDFAPLVAIALVFSLCALAEFGLKTAYARLAA